MSLQSLVAVFGIISFYGCHQPILALYEKQQEQEQE